MWLAVGIAGPASAAELPQLLPPKDVAIIYRRPGGDIGGSAQKPQAAYADSGRRIRLDFFLLSEAKVPFETWIYDANRGRLPKVRSEQREYTVQDSPGRRAPGQFITEEVQFERQRMAAVAGQACMNWAIKSSDPVVNGAVAGITDEGVLLRTGALDQTSPPVMVARAVQHPTPRTACFRHPPASCG